ncbi:MAG: hypothetical protein CMJ24_11775 [Phycisphaerae bacterium]|nr:hypothetical protein [Phycisphaerae bacterium]
MSGFELSRFVRLAIDGVDRPFPYHLSHVFDSPREITSPRDLTPVFCGCFDWHSAVHGHWLLVRGVNALESGSVREECVEVLRRRLNVDDLNAECDYLSARPGFERPYGQAWVLALASELHVCVHPDLESCRESLLPLEQIVVGHLVRWLSNLSHPIRSGTHAQTAFAFVLVRDWAKSVGNTSVLELIDRTALAFHGEDTDCAIHLEPSGEDFLSPSLGGAWLLSRVLDSPDFAAWLDRAIPGLGRGVVLSPVIPRDRADGRLCHLDGLNLSRAWMLRDIAACLPAGDGRRDQIEDSVREHRAAGLEGVESGHYTGAHWLGTFAAWLECGAISPEGSID